MPLFRPGCFYKRVEKDLCLGFQVVSIKGWRKIHSY